MTDARWHDLRPAAPPPAGPLTFVEQAEYEKGFAPYFAQHVAPLLSQLEEERLRTLRQLVQVLVIGAAAVILVLLLISALPANLQAIGWRNLLIWALMAAAVWSLLVMAQYGGRSRSLLLRPVVRFFDTLDCPDTPFDLDRLKPFRTVPRHDRCSRGAYVRGSLDGVGLEIVRLDLSVRAGRSRQQVFNGAVLLFALKKPCAGETVVHQRSFLRQGVSASHAGLEPVALEDPAFAQQFTVYATDQVEARYLLTTAFMERLKALSELMQHLRGAPLAPGAPRDPAVRRPLNCDFLGGQLLVMVDLAHELFEVGSLFRTALQVDDIRRLLYQIFLIRRIVELINLGPTAIAGADTHPEKPA